MNLLRILVRLFSPPRSRRSQYRSQPVVISLPHPKPQLPRILRGRCHVIDGDTIVIENQHIRIAGIDAPELEQPWGKKSKWALIQLCKSQLVTAHIRPEISYDRVVAECYLPDGRDLAAELVSAGMALDWQKFSGGKYRHLEPELARRKLWLVDARQRGKLPAINKKSSVEITSGEENQKNA